MSTQNAPLVTAGFPYGVASGDLTSSSVVLWTKAATPGATAVCRLYGNPAVDPATGKRRGPNSHFYTFAGAECDQVRKDPGWLYEAAGRFFLVVPAAGTCGAGLQPVYRAYNNGFAANDSNHRYAVKQSIYSGMVASGWKGEGIVMCAPASP